MPTDTDIYVYREGKRVEFEIALSRVYEYSGSLRTLLNHVDQIVTALDESTVDEVIRGGELTELRNLCGELTERTSLLTRMIAEADGRAQVLGVVDWVRP